MDINLIHRFIELSKLFSKPHPWHGLSIGAAAPDEVRVFIEIVPGDTMKYELDKESGFLKIDRPQRFSSICPVPYGFVPQTLCAERVGEYCSTKTGRENIEGDGDPLDICIISERNIPHGNIILDAVPVGGLRMIDGNEADDKIIAVMKGDALYHGLENIDGVPDHILERLSHYFLTYKEMPGTADDRKCEITDIYGREEAREVIRRSQEDYRERFNTEKKEFFSMIQMGLK